MKKFHFGLLVLAFLAGAGLSAIVLWRAPHPDTQAPQEVPSQKAEKQDTQEEKPELEGKYGDPATCDALLNAATYERDEDYMFMLAGRAPWVFRTRQDLQMAFEIEGRDIALYQKLVNVLRLRGTELVLAYIPTRGMIAEEFLPAQGEQVEDYDAASARENYNGLIARMNAAGVAMVGTPAPSVGAAYFNHADQHWSTQGARDMAQAIAHFVKEKGIGGPLPVQVFKTAQGDKVKYDGRFGEFIKKACGFRPEPEEDYIVKTERVDAGEDALLGETAAPSIVLVGTSNSIRDEFNSNFAGYLKEALSADVYNAAISGGGMDDAILAYLTSDLYRASPPKILIWELPGYYDMGGKGMEFALRQAIASAAGDCEQPLASLDQTPVEGKKVNLFGDIENTSAAQAYVALQFDTEVAKDFSISIKTDDQKNQKFKFKKRREDNGNTFYYWPKGEALLSAVTLNVNKNIEGKKVSAKLCPLPQ